MIRDAPGETAAEKAVLRRRLLAARAAIAERQHHAASAAVAQQLDAIVSGAKARTVAAYAATGSELMIDAWLGNLMAAGIGVFLPFVDGADLQIARVVDLDTDVEPGWHGVREPASRRRRPARVDRVDVFIVPGVAFDRTGMRLGYGGGHFDRLLARADPEATVIGVAFETQIVDALPTESHDVRMDYVVTERRRLPEDRRSRLQR